MILALYRMHIIYDECIHIYYDECIHIYVFNINIYVKERSVHQ